MATRRLKFKLYRDRKKQWRWQLLASNGRVIADSAESYKTSRAAEKMVERIQEGAADAVVDQPE